MIPSRICEQCGQEDHGSMGCEEIEEEYDKLSDAMEGAERSIQQTIEMDWVSGQGMKDFLKGMLHQCRYDLVLLDIWKPRLMGEEEEDASTD